VGTLVELAREFLRTYATPSRPMSDPSGCRSGSYGRLSGSETSGPSGGTRSPVKARQAARQKLSTEGPENLELARPRSETARE
jgi:hypothetical protein